MRTSGQLEVRKALEGVARRFREYGFTGPLLYATDDCCHEEKMLSEVFETLRGHGISVCLEEKLPPLELPAYDRRISYLTNHSQVVAAIGELRLRVNKGSLRFVGLDAEWVPGSPVT